MPRTALLLIVGALAGCTHEQLARSTVDTAGTVMDIVNQMELNNLARFSTDPDALPAQIRIKDGTVQVTDEWGIYNLRLEGGSSSATFGGPRAQRNVSEQWGADAITDPLTLKRLQDAYRAAFGLPPLPDPTYLRKGGSAPKEGSSGGGAAKGGSNASSSKADQHGGKSLPISVDPERDIPTGWFHVGPQRQVPADAPYVGHYHDRWVWVMPEGLARFHRFSLAVLFIAKLKPGEINTSSPGLMNTPGSH